MFGTRIFFLVPKIYNDYMISMRKSFSMFLPSGLVLFHHCCVLTSNQCTCFLHGRLCEIFSVTICIQSILNGLDGVATSLHSGFAQGLCWTPSTLGFPYRQDNTLARWCSINANSFLIDKAIE